MITELYNQIKLIYSARQTEYFELIRSLLHHANSYMKIASELATVPYNKHDEIYYNILFHVIDEAWYREAGGYKFQYDPLATMEEMAYHASIKFWHANYEPDKILFYLNLLISFNSSKIKELDYSIPIVYRMKNQWHSLDEVHNKLKRKLAFLKNEI